MENHDIRKAGLKVTLPRVKILEILESSEDRHMTAEEVYKSLLERNEEIGLATVYRVLTQFVNAGLAEKHHFEGGQAIFELDRGHHHDHIVCVECGRVEEFVDESIERSQRDVARKHSFEITDHSLIIYGSCKRKKCPHREAG